MRIGSIIYGVCSFIGITMLWAGVGCLFQKIKLFEDMRRDFDLALARAIGPDPIEIHPEGDD